MTEAKPQGLGIFVSRGVRLRIKDPRIVFGPNGPEIPPITAQVALGMSPFWLEIAITHLESAEQANAAVVAAAAANDDKALGNALESEFVAGMQAIVAAAIAIDALYASVREHVTIPETMALAWKTNRTARIKRVAEVLRRAFKLKPRGAANLRQIVRELYRFRDMAVHPSGEFSAPVLHPDAHRGTEWRFVAFGARHARELVRGALAIAVQLPARVPEGAMQEFVDLCNGVVALIEPTASHWRSKYGPLNDEDESA